MHFTHLHVHSHYSLLDGLPKIDDLVAKAKENEMEALALTDHGVMYGVVEFYQKARAAGIKPIIGVEVYLAPNGRLEKRARVDEKRYHLILLAKSNEGYQNLLKLTSLAHLEGYYYKPRIDWEILEKYHEGLIALSSCLQGEIPVLARSGNDEKTKKTIEKYYQLFGAGNFYLELQHHPSLPDQEVVNKKLVQYNQELNIPLVATNDIHYLNPEDAEAQDVLLCLQTKKKKTDHDRMNMLGEDFSFKSPVQMIREFEYAPEAVTNTQKIVDACQVELDLGHLNLPYYEVPNKKSPDEYLKELCQEGIKKRFESSNEKIEDRLNYELSVIKKTGFASYFLIVQDFVNWAKAQNIVVGPGRGSAPGSLVSYLLGITNVDPLKYNLFFERFLNPERINPPDIDLDFADIRRDEVIEYVENKYGKDHVAQIITFGTMAARAAIRDVGRVLDFPYTYCDRLAKLIPMFSTLDEALNISPELKQVYDSEEDARKIIETAKKLEGVSRHASTHACGVLITKDPLDKYVPLQYASSGDRTVVSQYSLHPVEALGLLKMDFLGLKNLTILENTIDIVKKVKEIKIKIDEIFLDDSKTFRLLQRGETTGVFQLESSGMKRYLKLLKPTDFEDIIAMVSLYRPGPMELIPDYIAGKHGQKETHYLHPKLEPILKKTFGIAVYQEQVLQIAQELAGFTLGEADLLRKAVGKKIHKLLKEQKKKFIEGCVAHEIDKKTAEKVFKFIEPFAGYGFNRAHGACYALIAYQTAYLKANFSVEFMAALLTSDQDDIDRIGILVEECQEMGLEVLPPDINESFSTFTVVASSLETPTPRIRFGLLAIKNVGSNIVKTIIKERKESGPYKNLEDFLSRVKTRDLNKKSLESLIKCGALDRFGLRKEMLDNMDLLLTFVKNSQREAENGQTNLFGLMASPLARPSLKLTASAEASQKEKLSWEKELLGLYISEHPYREFEPFLKNKVTSCRDLISQAGGDNGLVKVAGIITKIQKILTRKGEPMLFVKLEDTTGSIEILVFPKLLQENPDIWQEERMVLVSGRMSDKDGEVKLLSNGVESITLEKVQDPGFRPKEANDQYNGNGYKNKLNYYKPENANYVRYSSCEEVVFITLSTLNNNLSEQLKSILNRYPGGRKVYLVIKAPNISRRIETNFSIDYKQTVIKEIENITGPGSAQVVRK